MMQNDVAGGEGDECNNDVVGNGNGNANDNDIPSWYRFVVFLVDGYYLWQ